MKWLIAAVVCGCFATAFPSAVAADPRADDKLPVLKPKEIRHINPKWTGTSGVAFGPDGKRVVVAANGGYGPNGIFVVWDVETGKKLFEANVNDEKFNGALDAVAWSPDGKVIATGGARSWTKREDRNAVVDLWDAETGKRIRRIEGRAPGHIHSVAFSPDGKRIVGGGSKGEQELKVWEVETGKELLALKGHKSYVLSAIFSGDGKRIVSSDYSDSTSHTARVWDAETGKELLALKLQPETMFSSVAINRDGTRLVTGGHGRPVKLWNADTGKELHTFGKAKLKCVAFHPNGKWVVGTGRDDQNLACVVTVWDLASGRKVVSFRAHDDFPEGMDISADGKRIAVCFDDGHVSVWNLNEEP